MTTPEAQPGVIPLRPLRLGDIYGATKDILVRNWMLLLGIALGVSAVEYLLGQLISRGFQSDLQAMLVDRSFSSGDFVRSVVSAGVATLLVAAVGFLLGLAVSAVGIQVVHAEVRGGRVDAGAAVAAGVAKLGRLVAMTLLLAVIGFAGFMAVFGLMFTLGQAAVLFAFAWVVVCVYFGVLFSFASAAIVVEDAKVIESLGRSKDLVTGGWWRVFGILLLTGLIFSIVGGFVELIVRVDWLGAMIVGMVSTPATVCVVTLLYFDYRLRREGPRSVLAEPRPA